MIHTPLKPSHCYYSNQTRKPKYSITLPPSQNPVFFQKMEKWDAHKSLRDYQKRHSRENPSFSSTLLDTIYRSIDDGQTEQKQDHLVFYRDKPMRKQKQSSFLGDYDGVVGDTRKSNLRRNSLTEFDRRRTRSNSISVSNPNSFSMFSSSSSSDSSSGYGFSSSESESLKMPKPKLIRTSISSSSLSSSFRPQDSTFEALNNYRTHSAQTQKPNHEKNGFGKTKSKAFKILYGDLKKSKQPISPGARLASFLNSLFNSSGNTKKAKVSSNSGTKSRESKPAQSSTCSSASSFSRSCLSKTPSSRSGAKRSVRFCPVSVIVDEDCRPCGQKNVIGEDDEEKRRNEELRFHVMKESRRVEEFARELLKKKKTEFGMKYEDDEDEDDDDGVSCSSSDLFELDNLSAIGIQRYREELPVYETTHFDTNRAIANGFIL